VPVKTVPDAGDTIDTVGALASLAWSARSSVNRSNTTPSELTASSVISVGDTVART
jgi:hypothetical protein